MELNFGRLSHVFTTGKRISIFFFAFHNVSFLFSEADPKGSDCYENFKTMQDCFAKYPTVYNKGEEEELDLEAMSEEGTNSDLKTRKPVDETADQIDEVVSSNDRTVSTGDDKK